MLFCQRKILDPYEARKNFRASGKEGCERGWGGSLGPWGLKYYLSKKNCPTLCKSPFIDQDNTIWLLRWWLVFCMASPRGYHCRHAPRHAFVEIFEVLCSDGPPNLLCDFDDSRHGRPSVVGELFGYLSMGKAILMMDNYRFLLAQG